MHMYFNLQLWPSLSIIANPLLKSSGFTFASSSFCKACVSCQEQDLLNFHCQRKKANIANLLYLDRRSDLIYSFFDPVLLLKITPRLSCSRDLPATPQRRDALL